MLHISQANIEQAATRIQNHIHRTPVMTSQLIDEALGVSLYFKCENFQKAGAFKSRGAMNAVLSLDTSQSAHGVATHSSGNHAQALARAAKIKGLPAHIVMPENAPEVKISAVEQYGGKIYFCKPTLEAREQKLKEVVAKTKATEIHPYDNYTIIAGQATAAKELLEDHPELDLIICPVGGGGLLSGTALSVHYFSSKCKVIAAEPKGADDACRSFKAGHIIPSVQPNTIADGLLTSLGERNFPIIKELVTDIITVKEATIIQAMKLLYERLKIVVESSAVVPLALLLEHGIPINAKQIGLILSGGNVDLKKLPF